MKKLVFTVVCTAFCAVAFAQAQGLAMKKKPSLSPEEQAARKAKAMERMLKHTGGMVAKPGTQKGEIVYVNCQTAADRAWLVDSADYFNRETKCRITVKDGSFDLASPKVEGDLTIFVVDDAKLPKLLAAPENRWAMVNVAPLKEGAGEKPAFLQARTRKELSRAFGYLCGAVNSQFKGSLMAPVVRTEDLDQCVELRLPVDIFQRMRESLPAWGVEGMQYATYRNACREGWAAQPTNDYQKAIWQEVRELPTNPIKIKYDPKTGK